MKIINILAIASFGMSISLVGGTIAGYFWLTNPATIENIKKEVMKSITPGITDNVTKSLPTTKIPPFPSKTGPAVGI
tara:strand:- start:290 stop:520 length:231 start_codon:yes stop_codon:yes gene_type:complete